MIPDMGDKEAAENFEALEDAEDVEIAREALAELDAAGGEAIKAGWVNLEDVIEQWQRDEAVKLRD